MQTVAASKTIRKNPTAFFAHLYDEAGTLHQIADVIYFVQSDTGIITVITPSMCNFLTVLGEIGLAETAVILDTIHGGAAWIATHRLQKVA